VIKHSLVPTRAAIAKLVSEARQLGNLSGLNLFILRLDLPFAQLKSELQRLQNGKRDRRVAGQITIHCSFTDAHQSSRLRIQEVQVPQREV